MPSRVCLHPTVMDQYHTAERLPVCEKLPWVAYPAGSVCGWHVDAGASSLLADQQLLQVFTSRTDMVRSHCTW